MISLRFGIDDTVLRPFQRYSIGIHPWDAGLTLSESDRQLFEETARREEVVAIGEAGIDLTRKDVPLFRQLNVFKSQIELSELIGKPMVLHDVKAHDLILGLRRDYKPVQNWAIHGFRGKPEVAKMLLDSGCYISFGEKFNPATLQYVPEDRILAETDEAPADIEFIISALSREKGKDLREIIVGNTARFLGK